MITDAFRRFKHRRRQARALAEIAARPDRPGRPHGLSGPLIVSLTSHAARFATLAPTLRALTRQTVQPDRVILWLAEGDQHRLPPEVRAMAGLEIRICPDWRSYKKIVPTLMAHPDAFIATADDDLYVSSNWLEAMVEALRDDVKVVCHRAHRIRFSAPLHPADYESWQQSLRTPETGADIFPTRVC